MELVKEGINRPDLFPQCGTCQVASSEMIKARTDTGNNNIEISCEEVSKKKGILRRKVQGINMTALATFQEHKTPHGVQDFIDLLGPDLIPTSVSQFYYERKDVTEKCPGLRSRKG